MDPAEKKDFQDTLKIVEKKTRKIARLEMEHNKLGDKLDDYESNFEGKMNNITKGFNKAFSNNNKDNNNNN
jgi:predicted  nucleic acid-binding Zn-ribbon protein